MKKKLLILLCTVLIASSLTACGKSSNEEVSSSDTPAAEVGIEGKNSDEITGFTYLYDYGNGFRLYADNYTKIVYVMYYNNSGNGAKSTASAGLSPWLSQNGKYCYIDTDEKLIKELDTNQTVDFGNSDENSDSNSDDTDKTKDTTPSTEEGKSSKIDQSVTDKINQNAN